MGESLNQPSRVKDYGPMGLKLLLYRGKVIYEYMIASTIRIRIG